LVKKLIAGLLKRKDKPEAAPGEEDKEAEVPDELPPLAEDIVEPVAEAAQPEAVVTENVSSESILPTDDTPEESNEDTPDELPSLDIDEPQEGSADDKNQGLPD